MYQAKKLTPEKLFFRLNSSVDINLISVMVPFGSELSPAKNGVKYLVLKLKNKRIT
jgi:hypothetical protein